MQNTKIGPRVFVRTDEPARPGNGTAHVYVREIYGVPFTFTHVVMPDGENRYFVSRFNGYCGGPRFACAWTSVHGITIPPKDDEEACYGACGFATCENCHPELYVGSSCEDFPCCGHEAGDCHGKKYGSDASIIEAEYRRMARADLYGEDY